VTAAARPPTRPARPNTTRVLISLTRAELDEIDAAARAASMDRTTYIRTTMLGQVRRRAVGE